MSTSAVPIVDVARWRADLDGSAAADVGVIDAACVETGFFVVTGHGLDVDGALAAARRFFALPRAEKDRSAMVGNNGYAGPESARTDGKEMFDIELAGIERWPTLAGFRETVERYRAGALAVATDLLRALTVALGIEPAFFADRMLSPQCYLRMLRYPAAADAKAHTDYGAITLLATDGVPGLEVRPVGGAWQRVDAPVGALVVNLGDMLARWTNDRYRSTPHRVLPPATERISIPFFVNPDPQTVVTCIPTCVTPDAPCRYEPITAGDFLQGRIDGTIPTGDGVHS